MMSPSSPNVAAVILAAGQSQRMGRNNKLLAEIDGKPMIKHVVEQVEKSQASTLVLVTGHKSGEVKNAVGPLKGQFVNNPNYEEGMSTSLCKGIEALDPSVDGALIILGDMPEISPNHIDKLIEAFTSDKKIEACLPVFQGKRGNPVLWGRRYFDDIRAITGDKGARDMIKKHLDEITLVNMPDDGILTDVDTPDALERLNQKNRSRP